MSGLRLSNVLFKPVWPPGSGSTSYRYERRGLLRSENRTILGNSYAQSYQYDRNGNRSQMTYPSGRVVTYAHDFANRPYSASSAGVSFVSSASYLPFGPMSQIAYGNGTTKNMAYDLRYRPARNSLSSSTASIADYTYVYDGVGNIKEIHDALDPTYNRDFSYDDLSRLTLANTGAALWGSGAYSYDAMGNVSSSNIGSTRTSTFNYQGSTPKLNTATENGVARSVLYDPSGNETALGARAYTYSARNYLAAGDGLSYTYDGRGLRLITTGVPTGLAAVEIPSGRRWIAQNGNADPDGSGTGRRGRRDALQLEAQRLPAFLRT